MAMAYGERKSHFFRRVFGGIDILTLIELNAAGWFVLCTQAGGPPALPGGKKQRRRCNFLRQRL